MSLQVPFVSIILPHYNRSEIIGSTLESIISQTYMNWEAIIVDDKSDCSEYNNLLQLIQDKRIKVIKNHTLLKGPSICRNLGVKEAKGKYLLFLDSDDQLAPFCLEQRVSVMESQPDLVMGVFLMYEFSIDVGDSEKVYNRINLENDQLVANFIRNNNPWQTMAPLWRKDFFQSIGGFDEELFYMEDPELHLRALLESPLRIKTFYRLSPDCYYRINYHDHTKIGFYENSIKYRLLFYEKICELLKHRGLLELYANDLENGLKLFFKQFLIVRMREHSNYLKDFIIIATKYSLLKPLTIKLFLFTSAIWRSDSKIIKVLKLRGLSYKLLV